MPLGLVAGVRTQGQVWPFQEVHHCATHVMVAHREKVTPKLLIIKAGNVFLRDRRALKEHPNFKQLSTKNYLSYHKLGRRHDDLKLCIVTHPATLD